MGTGYTRNDGSNNIADGNIINASDLDGEFDAIQAAFDASTGHTHDGTSAEGAPITVTGPAQEYVSTGTEFRPKTNNTYDLGSLALQWKNLYVDGTAYLDAVDIDGGAIDGTAIGGSTAAAGSFTTLGASGNATVGGTLGVTGLATLASVDINAGNIDGTTIGSASAAAGTFTTLGATTGNITTVNATTVDSTNLEITNIKAKDGTSAGSIANSTGVVTLASSVLTTTDINGGTIDGVTIGGASAGAGTFTNLTATGTTTLAGASTTADITFGDNDKAIFGAGSDLQIYHDGSNSIINDNGTGALQLQVGGSTKLATTSTGVDVTGTVTADGLTVDGNPVISGTSPQLFLQTGATHYNWQIAAQENVASAFEISSGNLDADATNDTYTKRLVVQQSGDISFYEDTGTTPKFFWDASAESLTVNSTLKVEGGTTNGFLQASGSSLQLGASTASNLIAYTNNAERMRIDSSGNVGIGTSSPSNTLHVQKDTGATPTVYINNSGGDAGDGVALKVQASQRGTGIGDASIFSVHNNTSEIFTVRNDGNVGIGTSSITRELELWNSDSTVYGSTTRADAGTNLRIFNTSNTNSVYAGLTLSANNGGSTTSEFTIANVSTSSNYQGELAFQTRTGVSSYAERMRIDSSGNLLVGKTNTSFSTAGSLFASNGEATLTRSNGVTLSINRLSTDGDIVRLFKDGTTVGSIGNASSDSIYINGNGQALANLAFGGTSLIYPTVDNVADLGAAVLRFDDVYATNALIQTSDRNEKQDIAELDEAERRVAVAAKGLLRKFRWRDAVAEKGDDARIHFGIIAQDLQAAFAAEGLDAGKYAMFIHTTWTDEETGEERSRMGVRYSELLAFIIAAI